MSFIPGNSENEWKTKIINIHNLFQKFPNFLRTHDIAYINKVAIFVEILFKFCKLN